MESPTTQSTTQSTSPAQANEGNTQHIRLACQACQRKKIRCDRTFPCGQCQKSSLHCVPSTRKPRMKHSIGKRKLDHELRNRIAKLESLVDSMNGGGGGGISGSPAEEEEESFVEEAPEQQQDASPASVGKFIGSPFWATLTSEVQALRDALEEDDDDESDGEQQQQGELPMMGTMPGMGAADHDLLICGPAAVYVMPGALPEPSPPVARQLYDLFLHNVDPVCKVLHRPTLRRFLDENHEYLGHPADSAPNRALKAVMWLSAISSIHEAECLARFQQPRGALLDLYRRHVDVALAHADLLNTRDLATLQAFTVYIVAARMMDQSRRPWTMTGLVIRIAYGMGLQREIPGDSSFTKELKRRLWHQIRVLDAHAAIDRGTELLIDVNSFDTPLPSNVNDSEFDEHSVAVPHRAEGLSDVTFNIMCHVATTLTTRLCATEKPGHKGETWQQRLDLALCLGKELREKYLQYCDLSIPFHRFIHTVGNSMSASSVLRAVRPMQKHVASVPPPVDSPFVLQLAVNCLRESEATQQDPETEGWRWVFWVQWHAVAVALAGLCSIRDTDLARTAWWYVEQAYERHSRRIADTRSGMLWRPIEKLYKKACVFRDEGGGGGSSSALTNNTNTNTSTSTSISGQRHQSHSYSPPEQKLLHLALSSSRDGFHPAVASTGGTASTISTSHPADSAAATTAAAAAAAAITNDPTTTAAPSFLSTTYPNLSQGANPSQTSSSLLNPTTTTTTDMPSFSTAMTTTNDFTISPSSMVIDDNSNNDHDGRNADFTFTDGFMGDDDGGGGGVGDPSLLSTGGDMTWMDWERIMEDLSFEVDAGGAGAAEDGGGGGGGASEFNVITRGDLQPPTGMSGDWPSAQHLQNSI